MRRREILCQFGVGWPSLAGAYRECGTTERPHYARGLCKNCYQRVDRAGRCDEFPRTRR